MRGTRDRRQRAKEILLTRIYREVGLREGWLQPLSEEARRIITETFVPILRSFDHKKDYYLDLWGELYEVFGEDNVRLHVPQAYGSAIIAVLIPGFLQEAYGALLQDELNERAGKLPPHARHTAIAQVTHRG